MSYPLSEVRGKHSGECVIIANGSSTTTRLLSDVEKERGKALKYPLTVHDPELLKYPLDKIPVPIITVNQAWKLVEPTFHVVAEQGHYTKDPDVYQRFDREKKLFTIGAGWDDGRQPAGYCVGIRGVRPNLGPAEFREAIWSEDIQQQGTPICFGLTGSVTYSALQIADWLGFTEITFVGLDLFGAKFTGQASGKLSAQREMFRAVAPILREKNIDVRVVGLDSMADCWTRIDWPW